MPVRNTLEFSAATSLDFTLIVSVDKLNSGYSHIPTELVQVILGALLERFLVIWLTIVIGPGRWNTQQ